MTVKSGVSKAFTVVFFLSWHNYKLKQNVFTNRQKNKMITQLATNLKIPTKHIEPLFYLWHPHWVSVIKKKKD